MSKVTIKDLIAKKDEMKARELRTSQLLIESLDGEITVSRPTGETCLGAMEMGGAKGNEYLVYQCVIEPNLKDSELQQAFGCVSPDEIVNKVFQPGEVAQIATECVKLAGYGDSVKLVAEVKN